MRVGDLDPAAVNGLLARFGLSVEWVEPGKPIRGSFWGEPEAGLIGRRVFVRPDTPVHSMLHETCHVAKEVLEVANKEIAQIDDPDENDSTRDALSIINLLRENLDMWKMEAEEN